MNQDHAFNFAVTASLFVLATACGGTGNSNNPPGGGGTVGVGGTQVATGGNMGAGGNLPVTGGQSTTGTQTSSGGHTAAGTGGAAAGGQSGTRTATGGSASGGAASGGQPTTGNGGATTLGTGGIAIGGKSAGTGGGAVGGAGGASAGLATGGASDAGGTTSAGGANGLHYYVSPNGTGTQCTSSAPCSITQAQTVVRSAAGSMQGDIIVELADGAYSLAAPLVFTNADSGTNGHTINWQAATGSHPVLSGAQKITGWTISDSSKNIYKASVPTTFATRQLYVAGKIATRARSTTSRTAFSVTTNGFTISNSSLNMLSSIAHPERAELHVIGSWTDRYAPVKSVANTTVTMAQPAWANNTWGYDTIQSPYRQGPVYVENAYEFLDQPGEWYQDTTAGLLYYMPLSGQDMSSVDVELPQLQLLVAVAGAAYDQPVQNLTFSGLTFSYTSWLGPNSSDGYADQQTGGYLTGTGYPCFEATRPKWLQMPAAVQVSVAKNISFVGDRFVDLGSVALGIGNDDNAHSGGLGLGANAISVTGCVFGQIAGGGIVIGGIQAKAHHPGGDIALAALTATELAMIDQNITINDNLVHDVGIDYRDFASIMFTYTQKVVVTHNEVYNLPYSGICSGYGWGTNDAGGNADYKTRAAGDLYSYQPLYANGTIAQNNTISANYVHLMQLQMNDGGCHYHLSANPGTTITQNYCEGKGSGTSGTIWGEYNDEGSAYVTETKNVYANFGAYVTANWNASNNTGHITFTNNWGPSASPSLNGSGNTVSGNVAISGDTFPTDAQTVVNAAGLEAAYANLKTNP
jgi:hypothetical protein